MEGITLDVDDITSVQHFYDGINTAIMTILSSNDFLSDYTDLHHNFDHKDYILPPAGHPQHNDANNIFKNMSRIILHHLKKKDTIKTQNAPAASLALRENVMSTYGFEILFAIIIKLSPQLGGHARDHVEYVKLLKISDGEPVLDYYSRAL